MVNHKHSHFVKWGISLSDNYSYLDQSQQKNCLQKEMVVHVMMHNYCTITQNETIATPPDDYEPNKIGSSRFR